MIVNKINFECSLRYANLTGASNDLTSILGTITEQISVLLKSPLNKIDHVRRNHFTCITEGTN